MQRFGPEGTLQTTGSPFGLIQALSSVALDICEGGRAGLRQPVLLPGEGTQARQGQRFITHSSLQPANNKQIPANALLWGVFIQGLAQAEACTPQDLVTPKPICLDRQSIQSVFS